MEKKRFNVSKCWPQLLIGLSESRKPCLNLCSQKEPRPPRRYMNSFRIMTFENTVSSRWIIFKNCLACSIQYLQKGKTNFEYFGEKAAFIAPSPFFKSSQTYFMIKFLFRCSSDSGCNSSWWFVFFGEMKLYILDHILRHHNQDDIW